MTDFEIIPKPVYKLFHNELDSDQFNLFMFLFQNIVWFSYRKGFQPIVKQKKFQEFSKGLSRSFQESFQESLSKSFQELKSNFSKENSLNNVFTSDSGWGCMLRCSQMLLINGFIKSNQKSTEELIRLFLDNKRYPFSIHQMIIIGNEFGKVPGDWYGPTMSCHILKKLTNRQFPELNVIITEQGTLYEDELLDNKINSDNNSIFQETILLVPLRLGVRKIEPKRYSEILYFLTYYGCLGIIGGTPRHALYFVGSINTPDGKVTNKLIAMDPHIVQNIDFKDLNTYFCKEPKYIHMNDMDPNLAFGFYFKDLDDYKAFKTMIDCNRSSLITIEKTRNYDNEDILGEFELI